MTIYSPHFYTLLCSIHNSKNYLQILKSTKMKYLSYIIIALFGFTSASAQNVGDAVRYSTFDPTGTAAAVGLGSSIGAMGGDFSVIGINPAGIAEFRKSAFTFTPSINTSSVDGYFIDDQAASVNRSRSSFLIDNISFVSSGGTRNGSWSTSNWAVGFSKLADFNRDIKIEGATEGTITERFVSLANNNGLDQFEAGLADEAGAIFLNSNNVFQSDFFDDDVVNKDQFIDQRGSISELSIGWGGNYDDKFNIGLSAGIPFISYSESKTYKENFQDGDFSSNLQYVESLNTSGVGLNFKLGMQYRAIPQLRIGAAIHSPTWSTLNDDFSTIVDYEYSSSSESGSGSGASPDGSFKYKYTSPWKAIGSIGSVYKFGEIKGFVNADFEYLDYKNNEFDFTSHSTDPAEGTNTQIVNGEIDETLGSSTNIRLGAEMAYSDLRFRAGYTISSSPYVGDDELSTSWSTGVGFRGTGFFVDLGYRRRSATEGYSPYSVPDLEERDAVANTESTYGKVVATIGFTF